MRSALTRIRRFGRGSSLSPAVLFGHPVSDLCACPMSTKGSSDDAQPEVRRQRRVGQAEAFELDVGSPPRQSSSRTPSPSRTGAMHTRISSSRPASRHCRAVLAPRTLTYLSPAAALAAATPLSRSPTKVTSGTGVSGAWRVSTNCGPSHPPPNGLPSLASTPLYGSSPRKVRLPTRRAPILPITWSAVGLGPRCSANQDMSPPGPAMKPSSDIVAGYSNLPMSYLRRDQSGLPLLRRRIAQKLIGASVATPGGRASSGTHSRRACLRAEPVPRPLRHRHRRPQRQQAPRG